MRRPGLRLAEASAATAMQSTPLSTVEALDKLTAPYDIVCLDLNLPDMDGLEVCRNIRAAGSPDR